MSNELKSRLDLCWEMGRTGRSPEALVEAQILLIEARRVGDQKAIAFALTCNAWFCLQLGYAEEGIDCVVEARSIYEQLEVDWGLALSSAVHSWIMLELGLSDLAFEEAKLALDAAERTDDLSLRSFVMSCKGMTLLVCRQDELATPILEEALELADRAGDACTIALNLINIGYSLASQAEAAENEGDVELGRRLWERSAMANDRAIEVARGYGDLWNLRIALCNGAETYTVMGELGLAEAYLDECADLDGRTGPREEVHYLYTRGEFLLRNGQPEEALQVCHQAARLAANSSQLDNKANTLRRLSEVEARLGDFQSALEHYRAYHEIFVRQMGDLTRRRAQIAEMQLQNRQWRAQVSRLETEAHEDALTGLPNRRAFDARFNALQGQVFSLAILDLDHFKLVNDRYSHMVGDAVLTRTGHLLLGWSEEMQAFRLGGEEFALLLPDFTAAAAWPVFDALRAAIGTTFWGDLGQGLMVTASIGMVDSVETGGRAMMEEADRRLYAAKNGGRNRVVGSGDFTMPRFARR
ncbi:tetratricopeptide repeat-containing diguanylate cyclase [Devosia faecipullorum]|uniref:tetratricopeptide repeat-containing diguanylate cyclase n=1 Tax=Devosia faecipullorum TaxID=2755039 RepID=UPI00187B94C9|nr:tetratricopeptide repeat-containing diguanylate cyclase [Devosia faecipullorum]MBE7732287.1 diguanylate cyclase [Devosia faecipullorum]